MAGEVCRAEGYIPQPNQVITTKSLCNEWPMRLQYFTWQRKLSTQMSSDIMIWSTASRSIRFSLIGCPWTTCGFVVQHHQHILKAKWKVWWITLILRTCGPCSIRAHWLNSTLKQRSIVLSLGRKVQSERTPTTVLLWCIDIYVVGLNTQFQWSTTQ